MSDDENSQDGTPPSDPSGTGAVTKGSGGGGGGGIADMLVRQGLVSEEQIQDAYQLLFAFHLLKKEEENIRFCTITSIDHFLHRIFRI